MSYTTYYISSAGQPSNCEELHETLSTAIDAWKSNIGAVHLRSGGKSVLIDNDDDSRLEWIEDCQGGYVTARGGAWEDEIAFAAQIASEDGKILTADDAARLID